MGPTEFKALVKKNGWRVSKKDREAVQPIFETYELQLRSITLTNRYPMLGFRPVKAAGYIFRKGVWINQLLEGSCNDGVFAEVSRSENEAGHMVGLTPIGVFFCDCKDYQFNLRAIRIHDGSMQQPCCHILAVVLNDPDQYLPRFLPEGEL